MAWRHAVSADHAYDADHLHDAIQEVGAEPIIPPRRHRRRRHAHDSRSAKPPTMGAIRRGVSSSSKKVPCFLRLHTTSSYTLRSGTVLP